VNVHIHRRWIKVEKKHPGGVAIAMHHVGIGLADRITEQPIANEPTIHIQELPVGTRTAQ
jgi:hypothetical protein